MSLNYKSPSAPLELCLFHEVLSWPPASYAFSASFAHLQQGHNLTGWFYGAALCCFLPLLWNWKAWYYELPLLDKEEEMIFPLSPVPHGISFTTLPWSSALTGRGHTGLWWGSGKYLPLQLLVVIGSPVQAIQSLSDILPLWTIPGAFEVLLIDLAFFPFFSRQQEAEDTG